ncbi:hypothetical protein H7F15_02750 [Pontibacter sp. Tf4]|uniref:hypothetical protein n=1 Tax=Pontibacter sp. Tf4 TaxID=2761620 RepID=UPI0016249518|nr:hypothetical protein [Pontibacter sp. Tf4]MBB6609944.1 hypothetical protein [Pontibacter sp. Tf4]
MLLYEDAIIQVHYEPASDVLTTSLQSARAYDAGEIRKAFQSVITNINAYHVTRLLLDLSLSQSGLPEHAYKQNMTLLVEGLKHTQLRKIARVGTQDSVREANILHIFENINAGIGLQAEFQNFSAQADALQWLTEA